MLVRSDRKYMTFAQARSLTGATLTCRLLCLLAMVATRSLRLLALGFILTTLFAKIVI